MDRTQEKQVNEDDAIRPDYGGYMDGMSQIPLGKWSAAVFAIQNILKGWSPANVIFIHAITILGIIACVFIKHGRQKLPTSAAISIVAICILISVLGLIALFRGKHNSNAKYKENCQEEKAPPEPGVKPDSIRPIEDARRRDRSHVHDRRDRQSTCSL